MHFTRRSGHDAAPPAVPRKGIEGLVLSTRRKCLPKFQQGVLGMQMPSFEILCDIHGWIIHKLRCNVTTMPEV